MPDEPAQEQGPNREMVGYGRPPLTSRFQPGRSGNPAGRPKGQSLTTLLRAAIQAEVDGRTVAERIAEVMVNRAMDGDIRFIKEVLDRVDGKAPQHAANPGPEISRIEVVYSNDWRERDDDPADQGGHLDERSALNGVPDDCMDAVASGKAALVIEVKAYRGVDFRALG
jgi:hypothetical protein